MKKLNLFRMVMLLFPLGTYSLFSYAQESNNSTVSIDLGNASKWSFFEYSRIVPNTYYFNENGLFVTVRKSSSPLFYKFNQPLNIRGFKANAHISGTDLGKLSKLAQKQRVEDSPLRLGFVIEGSRKLGTLEQFLAPAWVRNIHALAPQGVGISQIKFYSTAWNANDLNEVRLRGYSKLIHESWNAVIAPNGDIDFQQEVSLNAPVLAIWLSIDGDDLGIEYEAHIQSLDIYVNEPNSEN